MAQGCPEKRGDGGSPSTGVGFCRWRDDLFRNAGGVPVVKVTEQGYHNRWGISFNAASDAHTSLYIGSTHVLTPKKFMEDMRSLELAGTGSRAIPNGLRSGPGQRPFQEFYDEKYFTRDQAPSRPQPPPQQQPNKGSVRNILTRPGNPPSMVSSHSQSSGTDEKKKKKRFF